MRHTKDVRTLVLQSNLLIITYRQVGYVPTHLKGSGAFVGTYLTSTTSKRLGTWLLLPQSLPLFSLLKYFRGSVDEMTTKGGFETWLLI